MAIKNIIFYSPGYSADLFLSKAYVQRLIPSLRGKYNLYYSHRENKKCLLDLDVEFVELTDSDYNSWKFNKVFVKNDNLYINTWGGAYIEFFQETHSHANLISLNYIWFLIYFFIENILEIKVFNGIEFDVERIKPSNGIPKTKWEVFDIQYVEEFIKDKKDIVLFCNGKTRSQQTFNSGIEYMGDIVQALAKRNKNSNFVCTEKFNLNNEITNIFFTDDIFRSVLGGDINEISYLSTFCKLIVGKNSGTYQYCIVQDNTSRDCIFYSISDRQSDSLLYNIFNVKCSHHHFIGKEEKNLISSIDGILNGNKYIKFTQFSLIDDECITPLTTNIDRRNYIKQPWDK
jgi:hypothetical protein